MSRCRDNFGSNKDVQSTPNLHSREIKTMSINVKKILPGNTATFDLRNVYWEIYKKNEMDNVSKMLQ